MIIKTSIGTFNMSKESLNLLAIVFSEYGKYDKEAISKKQIEKVSDQIFGALLKSGYYGGRL